VEAFVRNLMMLVALKMFSVVQDIVVIMYARTTVVDSFAEMGSATRCLERTVIIVLRTVGSAAVMVGATQCGEKIVIIVLRTVGSVVATVASTREKTVGVALKM